MSFRDKVVVVTGASGGIGTEIVKLLAQQQAKLTLVDIDEKGLDATAKICKSIAPVDVLTIAADLGCEDQIQLIVTSTLSRFERIDVLINNAGIGIPERLEHTRWDNFNKVMGVNLRGPFFLIKGFLPELIKSKGTIVNTSSRAGIFPYPSASAYGVSKAGLDQLTRLVARETAKHGVRINSINPGITDTMALGSDAEARAQMAKMANHMQPLGLIAPQKIARWIVFLASTESDPMTGQCVSVDAGESVTKVVGRL